MGVNYTVANKTNKNHLVLGLHKQGCCALFKVVKGGFFKVIVRHLNCFYFTTATFKNPDLFMVGLIIKALRKHTTEISGT